MAMVATELVADRDFVLAAVRVNARTSNRLFPYLSPCSPLVSAHFHGRLPRLRSCSDSGRAFSFGVNLVSFSFM